MRGQLEEELGERLWVVHRLDRETSGIVLFARSAAAHRALNAAFERREVEKRYVAFVAGRLAAPTGRIDIPLHAARRGKARPARGDERGAKDAVTDYAVLKVWAPGPGLVSLVEARPRTGRHHQIRVHLKAVGTPVLFDPLYGALPSGLTAAGAAGRLPGVPDAPCRRLALHAERLVFPPLFSGSTAIDLSAPRPPDLQALEAWLDRWGQLER